MFVCIFAYSPGVYNVLLPASQSVAVEDEVTVSAIELTIGGGIHRHLFAILDTPDLKARPQLFYCTQLTNYTVLSRPFLTI